MVPIAIVGMACRYADAGSPDELFENLLAKRRAFRRIPDERLALSDYGADAPEVDRIATAHAAVLEGWKFDRLRFKVAGRTYRQVDLTHWLALEVADDALRDAGFAGGTGLPRELTGVLLGNTLTGEFARAQTLRLRWPYVRSVLRDSLAPLVPEAVARETLLAEIEHRFKAPFEPFGEESLAGGLSNTIAGRICNHFDLKGGGFTIDGACSSSLLAVAQACAALERGDLDVVLAGGVDLSLDPFELVGFSRAGALARNAMRVYDRRSEGFWPGEGCGILVLTREADAIAQGRRIHARIRGWGVASDGAGGISRPEVEGQLLALRRAYARAGFPDGDVALLEGHGTGTAVGDETELRALTRLVGEAGTRRQARLVSIGSVKANIGHTKAAAGAAGLIKAALALRNRVLPPMPGCETAHPLVDPTQGAPLRVQHDAEPWPLEGPLRVGVSSMGFGGINAHILLDSPEAERPGALSSRHLALARTVRDADLFLFSAPTRDLLGSRLHRTCARAERMSIAELADLAGWLGGEIERRATDACAPCVRAAVVASRPEELAAGLTRVLGWLEREGMRPFELDLERGVFLGVGTSPGRLGLLFPGQGAISNGPGALGRALGALGAECPQLEQAWISALAPRAEPMPLDTALAQPAIIAASLAGLRWLDALGIHAVVGIGHSVGELSALAWSGVLSEESALALAALRGRIVSDHAVRGGAMASIAAGPDLVEVLLKGSSCVLAVQNGPGHCVVSGELGAVRRVLKDAREMRVVSALLPVSHAFHSPHMAPCEPRLRTALVDWRFSRPRRRVVSSRTGAPLDADLDVCEHLVAQLCEPVRYATAFGSVGSEVDLWIELPPGRMLATLSSEIAHAPIVSLDGGHPGWRGLLHAAGAAHALGIAPRVARALHGRIVKPFDPDKPARFLESPCSQAAPPSIALHTETELAVQAQTATTPRSALSLLLERIAARCELPRSAVSAEHRLLSDLHLNSLTVSDLAATTARELGRPPLIAPGEFADATIEELAAEIESHDRREVAAHVAGVDSWVRAFACIEVEQSCPPTAPGRGHAAAPKGWRVVASAQDVLALRLADTLRDKVGGGGVLVHLPRSRGWDCAPNRAMLLSAAQAACEDLHSRYFVLVHHGDAGVALVRCLHQEAHSLAVRVIEVEDWDDGVIDWILGEVRAAAGYLEARYDRAGRRFERRLGVLPLYPRASVPRTPGEVRLGSRDVLLVTGGGKGIAAECGLALACASGCALGLVGRASSETDSVLRAQLERLSALGIRFEYAPADVADAGALERALAMIEAKLGPVSALLHGAGVNYPASLARLAVTDFEEALAPKDRGLEHLLAWLEDRPVHLVVAFGSVVAQIGLAGEAHYALANECLARRLEAWASTHPRVRCIALEWSIWSGVGMGERLGRVEALAAQNISAISPEEGANVLIDLLETESLPVRVVVSGRMGSPATLRFQERELPLSRFVDRIREYTPGVELIVETELSHVRDPYLSDHAYQGDAILPAVLGLEAMAQTAMALAGECMLGGFEQVRFFLPLTVPAEGKRRVRIAGLVREQNAIELALRSEATDFAQDHMRARAFFAPSRASGCVESTALSADTTAPRIPADHLYDSLFFQRGRFARVLAYLALHFDDCAAELAVREEAFFGPLEPQALRLGDPGARDAALHAVQACVPDRDLLPVYVERIELGAQGTSGVLTLRAKVRGRGAGCHVYDLEVASSSGALVERWESLEFREVAGASRRAVRLCWIAPCLEALGAALFPATALRAGVAPGVGPGGSERALALVRQGGQSMRILRRPDRKFVTGDEYCASTSHAVQHTLAVAGKGPLACDLELVTHRKRIAWGDLLGPDRLRVADQLARMRGEDFDTSATRVWSTLECARKLGLQRETPLLLAAEVRGEAPCLLVGDFQSASLDVLGDAGARLVATVCARRIDARV